jgi:hypothetical protein
MERVVAAAGAAIIVVSLAALILGGAVGLLLGMTLGRTKRLPKYLAAIVGGLGGLAGAWVGNQLGWSYYAGPIVHQIVVEQLRAPNPGEPPGMFSSLLLGCLLGSCIISGLVVVWTSPKGEE